MTTSVNSRRYGLIAAGVTLALVLAIALVAVLTGPAGAVEDDCVPSDGAPETYAAWSAWQVTGSGLLSAPTVPANTATHEWRVTGPVTVTDEDAWIENRLVSEAVPGQHYSLKGHSGIDKDEVPATPDENPGIWQSNTEQEPHDNGAGTPVTWYPVDPATSGLHFASHGPNGEGKRDWFYYRAPQDAVYETIEHPAVTHQEWGVEERTRAIVPAVEPVVCPPAPTETPTETVTVVPPPSSDPNPPVITEPKKVKPRVAVSTRCTGTTRFVADNTRSEKAVLFKLKGKNWSKTVKVEAGKKKIITKRLPNRTLAVITTVGDRDSVRVPNACPKPPTITPHTGFRKAA